MSVLHSFVTSSRITVVDDFVTKGSTLLAAASRVAEAFPETTVRTFALVRTMGFAPEIEGIVAPDAGTIALYFGEGYRGP
jgi:orotate phosphoribosyltransferase-like protein